MVAGVLLFHVNCCRLSLYMSHPLSGCIFPHFVKTRHFQFLYDWDYLASDMGSSSSDGLGQCAFNVVHTLWPVILWMELCVQAIMVSIEFWMPSDVVDVMRTAPIGQCDGNSTHYNKFKDQSNWLVSFAKLVGEAMKVLDMKSDDATTAPNLSLASHEPTCHWPAMNQPVTGQPWTNLSLASHEPTCHWPAMNLHIHVSGTSSSCCSNFTAFREPLKVFPTAHRCVEKSVLVSCRTRVTEAWYCHSRACLVTRMQCVRKKEVLRTKLVCNAYNNWLILKTIGNRKGDCAWSCSRWQTQPEKICKSQRTNQYHSLRTFYWFVLCNLQIFSGCVCHLEQLHAQSPFLFPIVF